MIKVIYNKTCGRCVQSEPLTSGMVGQPIHFEYSHDFDGLAVTAVFTDGKNTVDVVNPGNECIIPHEVLTTVGAIVKVGIYAVKGDELVIPTIYAHIGVVLKGADPSGDVSIDPTLPIWAQTQALIGNLSQIETETKDSLVAAINEVKQTTDRKANAADLAPVATSGSYNDLSDKPTIPSVPTATIDANTAARHTHNNKTLLDSITESLKTAWNTASEWVITNGANVLSHLSDGVRHITATERSAWNGKQDKLIAGANITIAADGKTISATGGGGSTVELDTTLSAAGKAADAKAVGDALPAYKINLTKYGISADGTNAADTTDGINQAITDAVAAGYGTIVFPKGEYLISGSDQINITGRLTVDFNNSVIRKEANANESYVMVEISGDHNVVKNATLYGDRETHDYSSGGTHEWGTGINISPNSRFTIIENVDVFDTTGYGMCTGTAYNQIEPIRNRPLESGCYDKNTGELVESTTHTILGYTLDITDSAIKNDMFILGGNGYAAHGIKEPMSFYMSFYDENETYIGFSRAYRLYDTIDLKSLLYWYPTLRYIKFSIENTDTETNVTLELRSSYTSDDITIKNCEIARCRTLGIAIVGGKRILVENVSIHDIGGAAPGYGVDIEDGYQLNQYIVFRSCEFYNNKFGDISVVKARDVLVENCRFQGFERLEGGTALPTGISAYGTITSKFVVRDSVFTGSSAGGEKFYLYNCIFIDCPNMEGDFTECRFYGCQIINKYGTTLNRCYLNGTMLRYRNGNFGCYDSVLENVNQWDENWDTGIPAEYWVMEGCLLKNCGPVPKTGVPYIRIANNAVYNGAQVGSNNYCLLISTKQKTHCQIVGNTFEQGGRDSIILISDTYGSDIYFEGNVFKSLLTSADAVVNADRVSCACTGRVSFNANTFDIGYMVAPLPVLYLENCAKATLTNNKFLGDYGVPIRMTSVTEAICDGNEYTGTPVLAENCKGVDIPNACSKSYVDGLIGDVNTVIASINSVVGGA